MRPLGPFLPALNGIMVSRALLRCSASTFNSAAAANTSVDLRSEVVVVVVVVVVEVGFERREITIIIIIIIYHLYYHRHSIAYHGVML